MSFARTLFANGRILTRDAVVVDGISRREGILKSLPWDPAGRNKDLHERYRIYVPLEWGRGSRQATKNPGCSGRLRDLDIRYIRCVTEAPGFRVYAKLILPLSHFIALHYLRSEKIRE